VGVDNKNVQVFENGSSAASSYALHAEYELTVSDPLKNQGIDYQCRMVGLGRVKLTLVTPILGRRQSGSAFGRGCTLGLARQR